MMKIRLARPECIIDINRLADLHYVKEEGGFLKIGGLRREADLETSDLIRSNYPIILDTAAFDCGSTSPEHGNRRRKSGSRRPSK
ncbi:MAG: aerobic carbon-monoxide dehydrogenase medium subunit [Verrucomicrobiota bacterium]|nr:aerobic carbon-monoxide dehydrogenase medium subunit [Verrucomicrobiota bacterium]